MSASVSRTWSRTITSLGSPNCARACAWASSGLRFTIVPRAAPRLVARASRGRTMPLLPSAPRPSPCLYPYRSMRRSANLVGSGVWSSGGGGRYGAGTARLGCENAAAIAAAACFFLSSTLGVGASVMLGGRGGGGPGGARRFGGTGGGPGGGGPGACGTGGGPRGAPTASSTSTIGILDEGTPYDGGGANFRKRSGRSSSSSSCAHCCHSLRRRRRSLTNAIYTAYSLGMAGS